MAHRIHVCCPDICWKILNIINEYLSIVPWIKFSLINIHWQLWFIFFFTTNSINGFSRTVFWYVRNLSSLGQKGMVVVIIIILLRDSVISYTLRQLNDLRDKWKQKLKCSQHFSTSLTYLSRCQVFFVLFNEWMNYYYFYHWRLASSIW